MPNDDFHQLQIKKFKAWIHALKNTLNSFQKYEKQYKKQLISRCPWAHENSLKSYYIMDKQLKIKGKTVNAILFRKNYYNQKEANDIIKKMKIKPIEKINTSQNYYTFRTGYYKPNKDYKLVEVKRGIQYYYEINKKK